jgi:hypothetical protein
VHVGAVAPVDADRLDRAHRLRDPSQPTEQLLPELERALDAVNPVARLGVGNDGLLVEGRAPDLGKLLREGRQRVQDARIDVDAASPDRLGEDRSGVVGLRVVPTLISLSSALTTS